ncbi:YihY/virulence factor BrkB family protein [Reichenbachiella versicolor]|uniref:YihY/virulence factor BrkB family protein n=1 Tax=Reichenbachiella versicolor TaxID=1821036 RepID=UPI000D6E69BA|nr:YihY/virulence factor BrkB family protein [Reichenbachiella versicolor]
MKQKYSEIKRYIQTDIWLRNDPKGFKGILVRVLRIVIIVMREVKKDQIFLKSSALTYLTILSVVPSMALLFGILKGFGLEISVEDVIGELFPAQEIVVTTTYEMAQRMIDSAKGGVIAGVSILILFFTVMRLLNNIELVFNGIWGKQRPRTVLRKFTDYTAIVVFSPILILTSSAATVFFRTQVSDFGKKLQVELFNGPLEFLLANFSSYFLIWIMFSLIYIILPNVKVNPKIGILTGILTGTVFQMVQLGFINFSVGVTKYNAIYGSLAALPLFFTFTQLSWTITCIGGEFAFALEKEKEYVPEIKESDFSINEKKRIAILVMLTIARAFEKENNPFTKKSLADALSIPHRYVSDSVNLLVDSGLLIRSKPDGKATHIYIPATAISNMTVSYVLNKFEGLGHKQLFQREDKDFQKVDKLLSKLDKTLANCDNNKLLTEI